MKPNHFVFIIIVLFTACTHTNPIVSEWRGPNRTGIYNESDLLKVWPEKGPEINWEYNNLGKGYGSPTIAGNKLWVVGTEDSLSYLFEFDVDGVFNQKYLIGKEWIVNFPGARCAPTIVDDLIYVMTGMGEVICFNSKLGKTLWQINMASDFDGVIPRFGYSQSLVVDENLIYCSPGGLEHNVVALNRKNGELIWSCKGKGERPAYHPAKLIETGSRKILTTFSAYHFMGIDAKTGELLWLHEQKNTPIEKRSPGVGDTHANSILFEDNVIYYIEGDGNCAVALALSEAGDSITQIWNNVAVDNFMGGIVLLNDFIYSGSFTSKTLAQLDPETGAVVNSLALGRGSLIAADDMLYFYTESGEMNLVNIANNKLELVSTFTVEKGSKEHFAHPVIDNGVLYIRHGEFLGAFSILNH